MFEVFQRFKSQLIVFDAQPQQRFDGSRTRQFDSPRFLIKVQDGYLLCLNHDDDIDGDGDGDEGIFVEGMVMVNR